MRATHGRYAPKGDSLGNSWRIAGDGTNWGALSNCANLNAYEAPQQKRFCADCNSFGMRSHLRI